MSSELPRKLGRYTLERLLARGGMGEIYLALSKGAEGIDKPCVIKSLPPGLAHDEEFVTRFLDEARIVTTLSHGNIAQVFEVGREGDEFFLVMEYVDGRDLRQVLARCFDRKIKPPSEIGLFIIQELLRGLSYAHRKGETDTKPLNLIHRDVCPQNVMVSFDGAVKLIDFGLAKSALKSLATNPTILLGKVAYMSPEQARREKLDRRSDIYSAGVVLYEVLTGKRRYNEKNPQDLLQRVRTPVPFDFHDTGLHEQILQILGRALAPTVEARYQTADEFRKEVSTALIDLYPRMDAERLGEFIRELFAEKPKAAEQARTTEFEKPQEGKPAEPVNAPKPQKTPAPKAEVDAELTEQFPEHMLAELFGSAPDHKIANTNPSYTAPTDRRSAEEQPEEDAGATIPAIQMPSEEDFAARAAARAARAARVALASQTDAAPPQEVEETQQMTSLAPKEEPPTREEAPPQAAKPASKNTPPQMAKPTPTPPAAKPASKNTPPQMAKPTQPAAKPTPPKPATPPSKSAEPPVAAAKPAPKAKAPPPPKEPEEDDEPIVQGPRTEVIQYPKPSAQRQQKQQQAKTRTFVLVASLFLLIPSAAILTAFLVNPTKVRTLFGIQASVVPPQTTPTTTAPASSTSAPILPESQPQTTIATSAPLVSLSDEAAKKALTSIENILLSKKFLREDIPGLSKVYNNIEAAKSKADFTDAIEKLKKEGLSLIGAVKIDANFIKKKTERLEATLKSKGLTKDPTAVDLQKQLKQEKKLEKKNEVLNKLFKSIKSNEKEK